MGKPNDRAINPALQKKVAEHFRESQSIIDEVRLQAQEEKKDRASLESCISDRNGPMTDLIIALDDFYQERLGDELLQVISRVKSMAIQRGPQILNRKSEWFEILHLQFSVNSDVPTRARNLAFGLKRPWAEGWTRIQSWAVSGDKTSENLDYTSLKKSSLFYNMLGIGGAAFLLLSLFIEMFVFTLPLGAIVTLCRLGSLFLTVNDLSQSRLPILRKIDWDLKSMGFDVKAELYFTKEPSDQSIRLFVRYTPSVKAFATQEEAKAELYFTKEPSVQNRRRSVRYTPLVRADATEEKAKE